MTYLLIVGLIAVPLLLGGQLSSIYPRLIRARCRAAGYEVVSVESSANHFLVRLRRGHTQHAARCRAYGLRLDWKGSPPPGLAP